MFVFCFFSSLGILLVAALNQFYQERGHTLHHALLLCDVSLRAECDDHIVLRRVKGVRVAGALGQAAFLGVQLSSEFCRTFTLLWYDIETLCFCSRAQAAGC